MDLEANRYRLSIQVFRDTGISREKSGFLGKWNITASFSISRKKSKRVLRFTWNSNKETRKVTKYGRTNLSRGFHHQGYRVLVGSLEFARTLGTSNNQTRTRHGRLLFSNSFSTDGAFLVSKKETVGWKQISVEGIQSYRFKGVFGSNVCKIYLVVRSSNRKSRNDGNFRLQDYNGGGTGLRLKL
jgi:hypothetical protein